jgi:spermidine synthase
MIEFGIAVSGLILTPLMTRSFPFYHLLYSAAGESFIFITFSQFVVSCLLMLLPTVLMGMTFPVCVKLYSQKLSKAGEDSGAVYSSNTLGAVLGVILAGFFLIHRIGIDGSLITAALLNVFAGAIILTAPKKRV